MVHEVTLIALITVGGIGTWPLWRAGRPALAWSVTIALAALVAALAKHWNITLDSL